MRNVVSAAGQPMGQFARQSGQRSARKVSVPPTKNAPVESSAKESSGVAVQPASPVDSLSVPPPGSAISPTHRNAAPSWVS